MTSGVPGQTFQCNSRDRVDARKVSMRSDFFLFTEPSVLGKEKLHLLIDIKIDTPKHDRHT